MGRHDFNNNGGRKEGHHGLAFVRKGRAEVLMGESLDDGDARGRCFFPLGASCFLPLSRLPPGVKTLSFLNMRRWRL